IRAGLRGLVRRRNPDPLCFRIGLGDCTIRGGDLRGSNRLSADSLDSKRLCSSCRYASACLVATFWYVIPAERTADPSGNRSHGGGSDIVRMGGPPAREDCRAFAVIIARHLLADDWICGVFRNPGGPPEYRSSLRRSHYPEGARSRREACVGSLRCVVAGLGRGFDRQRRLQLLPPVSE